MDTVQEYSDEGPVTEGFEVKRKLSPRGEELRALVQTTVLLSAVDGKMEMVYSIKTKYGTPFEPGAVIRVVSSPRDEQGLVGKFLLIDSTSNNGLKMINKAIAKRVITVRQEGKESFYVSNNE